MYHAIERAFVGFRRAQRLDPGIGDIQPAEGRVIVQRDRMEDTQGQQHLSLNIRGEGVDLGIDKHGCLVGRIGVGQLFGSEHAQADGLAMVAAQGQGRDDDKAAAQRPQFDNPAGDRHGTAVDLADQTQATVAEHIKVFVQWCQIELVVAAGQGAFQRQLKGLVRLQLGAVDARLQRRLQRRASA